jgi:hypothetical protein
MSHHYSGPNLGFPNGDARLNFTDLYVFPKPGDSSKTIFIMNVHPSTTLKPTDDVPTTLVPFSTSALYEVMIDTNGDDAVDIAYSVRVAGDTPTTQTATLRRIDGSSVERTGNDGKVIVDSVPVSGGSDPKVTEAGGYRFFAGWRSDPFFFDTIGAISGLKFTGTDYFAERNICAVVIEAPNTELRSANLKVWARTLDGSSGTWTQVDRGARASQEPFLAGDDKPAYLIGLPADDARFIPTFAHALEHTGGYMPQEATRLAGTMLPDVLPFQPAQPAVYPSNGRSLTDNAGGYFLMEMSNGKTNGGGLKPHTDLLAVFPYLGTPHTVRVTGAATSRSAGASAPECW